MPSETLAYIAGLIDGEGSFAIKKDRSRKTSLLHPTLTVTSTHKPVLSWLQDQFGGSQHPHRDKRKMHRPCWNLVWSGTTAVGMAKTLRPYLKIKYRQACSFELWPGPYKAPWPVPKLARFLREEIAKSVSEANRAVF